MVKPSPEGFISFKKNGRLYLRCSKTIQTPFGVVQCRYCTRKDKNKLEHKCVFESLELYKGFQETDDSKLIGKVSELPITDALINFISQTNVSFRAACSESMITLLRSAFEAGKNAGAKPVEEIIPPISRLALTKHFISKANAKRDRELDSLRNC